MSDTVKLVQNLRARQSIINLEINAQIKSYQRQLVKLNFSNNDASDEYHKILNKIKYLRGGLLEGKLRHLD